MIDIQKLIQSAEHHIKRGDAMAMDPQVVKQLAESADLIQIAKDFDEALGELKLHCNCGQEDCRTTRLRAALAKHGVQS